MKRSGNKGFSLLELLVAMTLMSIIAASLYSSLSIGFKARERSQSALAGKRGGRIVMDQLKQEIISALPPTGILAGRFEGADGNDGAGNAADTLTFYSAAYNPDDEEIACDIVKVEISMEADETANKRNLVRGITTNLLSPKTLDPSEDIICKGIRSINFRYFDGYEWQDEWVSSDNNDSLPKAVEICISFETSDDKNSNEENGNVYSLTCSFSLPCA